MFVFFFVYIKQNFMFMEVLGYYSLGNGFNNGWKFYFENL